MTAPQIAMHRIQEAVRLHRLGNSQRKISQKLGMGRTTLRRYLKAVEGSADTLPDLATLRDTVALGVPQREPAQKTSRVETWRKQIETMHARGAGPTSIHDFLRVHEDSYSGTLSSVKRFCRQLKKGEGPKPADVAIPVVTLPGNVAQSIETWQRIHVNAFLYFGGVPEVVVPDNLKAAVIRHTFGAGGNVELNRSYRELARFFGFQIDPTPVRSPEKKGKVERDAQYIENNFLATLPDVDAAECQKLLLHWNPIIWKRALLHRDTHVQVDKALYSVPWKHISQKLWVRCSKAEIEIFANDALLSRHRRGIPGSRTTVEGHLPEGRRDLRDVET